MPGVAVVATVASVGFAGGVLAASIAAVGASAQFAGIVADRTTPTPKKGWISGSSVSEVIESMEDAIRLATLTIVDTEDRIGEAVGKLNDLVRQHHPSHSSDGPSFCARRPALADATKHTIRREMGYAD